MTSFSSQPTQRQPSPAEQSSPISISNREDVQDTVEPTYQTTTTTTEDNQSVLLNWSSDTQHDNPCIRQGAIEEAEVPSTLAEPRHCWICLQDEGDEESEQNGEWRSPCPCNLQAHEECMLDWIADLEAPNPREGRPATKILCPQCKAEIKITRPVDIILSTVDLSRAVGRVLVEPAGLSAICGCLCAGSIAYGINAIHLVAGTDVNWVGEQPGTFQFTSALQNMKVDRIHRAITGLIRYTDPFIPAYNSTSANWLLLFAAPLIAPALILSRTSLADPAFAVLPVAFFTVRPTHDKITQWPPSPITVFAILPYLRTAYNRLYKNVFATLVKKWDRAAMRKPREGETAEEVARGHNEAVAQGEGILQLEVEINIGGPAEARFHNPLAIEGPLAGQVAEGGQPNQDAAPRLINNEEEQQAQQPNGVPGQGQAQGPNGDWDNFEFLQYLPSESAASVMGALFFPAISSVMGDLLKYSLPKRWVSKPVKNLAATGLLQEKWGRSIVGGCLFVVLKDMLVLYAKWRKAKNMGKRKVLDYVKRDELREMESGWFWDRPIVGMP